jgi:hypothetical protein
MAADIFHWFGYDLQVAPNGDLAIVNGTVAGQQSIVRRLLTKVLGYIFETTYGAGLSDYIGSALSLGAVEGVIRAQLYLEQSVSQNPSPVVTVSPIAGGLNVVIQYSDAQTGAPSVLNFNVND